MLRLRLDQTVAAVEEDGKYLPARGLLYSLLVHEIAFFAVSIFSITGPAVPKPDDLVTMIDLREMDVLYLPLPELGAPSPQPPKKAEQTTKNDSGRGLVYPGPQPIYSDFPNPTNRLQTLLQPSLTKPVVLPPPLSLPNLVQIPEYQPPRPHARPELARELPSIQTTTPATLNSPAARLPMQLPEANIPEAKRPPAPLQQAAALPQIRYANPATLQQPVLTLPVQIPETALAEAKRPPAPLQQAAALPEIRYTAPATVPQPSVMLPAQIPQAVIPEAKRPPAPLQQAAALPQIRDTVPAAVPQSSVRLPGQIPEAAIPEAKRPPAPLQQAATLPSVRYTAPANLQQTATLPAQIPAASVPAPSAPPRPPAPPLPTPPPPGAVRGDQSLLALSPVPATPDEIVRVPLGEARGRFAVSPQPNLAGDDNAAPGTGRGTGGARGGSDATTSSPASNSSNAKDGTASSSTTPATPGATGPAGASGRNEFPGITILGAGAIVENGRVSRGATNSPTPVSTTYGLTVLSTGASGGGLPQYGVFASSDQIHTVFLDMRRSMFDTSPSWTFQYALLNRPTDTETARPNQQGMVLPFPTTKDHPAMPADVVRRHLNKMLIVYGVVNAKGKFEALEVKQSPDATLNAPIVAALSKWVFKPAEFNGEIVPVKVLLGIPLSMP